MSYPLDLTGTAASNRIVDELHISTEQYIHNHYYIFPQYVSFYKNSLIVKAHNGSSWVTLTPNVDYIFKAIHLNATRLSGYELYGFIELINPTVNQTVSLTYQTLGGSKQPNVDTLINKIIDDYKDIPIYILDVLTTDFDPVIQTPTPSFSDYPNTKGELEVVGKLHDIANSIASGFTSISGIFKTYAKPVAVKGSSSADFSMYVEVSGDQLNIPFNVVTFPSEQNSIVNKSYVETAFNAINTAYNNLLNLYNNKLNKLNPVSNNPLYLTIVDTANTNTALTKGYVENAFSSFTPASSEPPVGTVIQSTVDNTPSGYLKCNGTAISKTTYSELYSVIGDAFAPPGPGAGIPWQSQCGFNPSTQNDITGWTSTNGLAGATSFAASFVAKNYIYILGGDDGNGPLNTIQRASFDSDGNLSSTWSKVGSLPVAMTNMGYVATKDRFYLIGGYDNSYSDITTVYSAPINTDGSLGTFRTEAPLPAPRSSAVCFVIKDKLYAVGGSNTNTVYRATVNSDGTLSRWESLPKFPTNIDYGNPMLIKDRIYIFGTHDESTNSLKNYYATYDSDGDIGAWTYVSDMPNDRYGLAIVCTDNYVFNIGGYKYINNKYTNISYRAPILTDGSIGDWTQISDCPTAASGAQMVIVGNKIYFIGGVASNYSNAVYSAVFTSGITDYTPYYADQPNISSSAVKESAGVPWQSQYGFNSSTQNDITGWTSANNLTAVIVGAASLVTKNYIYILGGNNTRTALNIIQRASFDANGDLSSTWSNVGTLPDSISSMGYVATKSRFYLIGGNNNSRYLSSVYSVPINPDGSLGDFRTETPLPVTREYPVCFVIKDKLYVVGGSNSNTVYKATVNKDGTLGSWTRLSDFPVSFDNGKPLLIKDRIYIFEANSDTSKIYYATYDSNGNIGTWTYVSDMPNNIIGSAVICTDNYVFSIAGYDVNNSKYTNAVYRAPISSDGSIGVWVQITNGPVAATGVRSVIAGNRVYFIGGYYYNSNNNSGICLNTVYSATFISGITDYTPYYTDQSSIDPNNFYLPNYYPDFKSIENYYIKY
jgi:N-acetylneuraminic acid mutarotase